MKKTALILLLALLEAGYGFSQNISIVNGVWERGKPGSVQLYSIDGGSLRREAISPVKEDGVFSFRFELAQEGYYVIGLSPSDIKDRYIFYFKPGDALNLRVLADSYELTGENTPENKEMARWHDFIFPLEDKAVYYYGKNSTYEDFFPLLEEKLKESEAYSPANTPNRIFNNSFEDFKRNDFLYNAVMFVQTPRSIHPKESDFVDYYKKINFPALTKNSSLLNYPDGISLLLRCYLITVTLDSSLSEEQKNERYSNPVAYLLDSADEDLIAGDAIKGEVEQRDAIDFKFADVNGKETALSDFKGKVVYIDIWATWCAPCRREFPFLKKLESEYHGNKDMVFIGVSVDRSRDQQIWKDFLIKESLPGVQLFAGDAANKSLIKPYKINGIPRFILVGKDGKLIFADAPRPSSGKIRAVIDEALGYD
ncbi:MAG: TlpA family protein disulfide reductase [Dysgonamonadaceae bacterium]|jgi:thiol-disulfide isomerase/thioredoxin|nr:TlpA family protein disulfide reductase [Dysgonamonadaceae bacterium]